MGEKQRLERHRPAWLMLAESDETKRRLIHSMLLTTSGLGAWTSCTAGVAETPASFCCLPTGPATLNSDSDIHENSTACASWTIYTQPNRLA